MQAPTTPSGTPVSEPDDRTCPGCGAANGVSAAFCWQCYRPFGAPAVQAAPAGSMPPAPGMPGAGRPMAWHASSEPYAPSTPKRSLGGMWSIALVTLAVIGGVVFFLRRGGDVELPQQLGGLPRLSNAQSDLATSQFAAGVKSQGIEGDMALYGTAEVPSSALIWIRDASVPTTEAGFDSFAEGFNTGIGGVAFDPTTRVTKTIDGVEYVCAPVTSTVPGGMCLWQDGDVFWLVFDLSGAHLGDTRALAVQAHDATA